MFDRHNKQPNTTISSFISSAVEFEMMGKLLFLKFIKEVRVLTCNSKTKGTIEQIDLQLNDNPLLRIFR